MTNKIVITLSARRRLISRAARSNKNENLLRQARSRRRRDEIHFEPSRDETSLANDNPYLHLATSCITVRYDSSLKRKNVPLHINDGVIKDFIDEDPKMLENIRFRLIGQQKILCRVCMEQERHLHCMLEDRNC